MPDDTDAPLADRLSEHERAVAEAVLHHHDRMENTGAKDVPTERIYDALARKTGFGGEDGRARLGRILRAHHGDLWIIKPQGDAALPSSVLLLEEMAATIERDVLGRA